MQQQQSWLIKESGIKIITLHSEMKLMSKRFLEWLQTSAWPCSSVCFCTRKSHLLESSAPTQGTIKNTLCITWCLLNVNSISDLLRNAWRATDGIIHCIPPLNLLLILLQNSNSNFDPTYLRKRVGNGVGLVGAQVFPIKREGLIK